MKKLLLIFFILITVPVVGQTSRFFTIVCDSAFPVSQESLTVGKGMFHPCTITIEGVIGNTIEIKYPDGRRSVDRFSNAKFNLADYYFDLPLNADFYKAYWDSYDMTITFYSRDRTMSNLRFKVVEYIDRGDPKNNLPQQ